MSVFNIPIFNPNFLSNKGLENAVKKFDFSNKLDIVLDIGSGKNTYKKFFLFKKYISLELNEILNLK